jgi:hypothetical protein
MDVIGDSATRSDTQGGSRSPPFRSGEQIKNTVGASTLPERGIVPDLCSTKLDHTTHQSHGALQAESMRAHRSDPPAWMMNRGEPFLVTPFA